MLKINETITNDGYIGANGSAEINMSNIFTELINAAGTYCERYASDLLYEINSIEEAMQNRENYLAYIGIRLNGVDGINFIKSRINRSSCNYEPNCYLRLYKFTIVFDDEERTITADLSRISEYDAIHELL